MSRADVGFIAVHAVLIVPGAALLYALGLVVMAYASTPAELHIGAGVLIGFGLSGCSFNLVLGAFSKLLPESWRRGGDEVQRLRTIGDFIAGMTDRYAIRAFSELSVPQGF